MILHRLTAADTKHAEVSILIAPPGHGAVYHPDNEGVSHSLGCSSKLLAT